MPPWVYNGLDALAGHLLPARCLLCQRPGRARGDDLCAACAADLPRRLCARVDELCLAPFDYEFPITRLVQGLKYEGALANARVLGKLLADGVREAAAEHGIDTLVPMPLHRSRLLERGFNQSYEIARVTGRCLALAVDAAAVERVRATAPQVGLDRAERRSNVHRAFAVRVDRVAGRHLALVDDVITTGSTAREASAALVAAGARAVDVWCIARAGDRE